MVRETAAAIAVAAHPRRAHQTPALMKSKPLDTADQAVESELALLVSEYLQFHHCTGAYEVSDVRRRDNDDVVLRKRGISPGVWMMRGEE